MKADSKKTSDNWSDIMKLLTNSFNVKWRLARFPKEAEWRADSRYAFLSYIDARDVMDRLDQVVGPDQWSDSYRVIETQVYSQKTKGIATTFNVECTLTIKGVSKVDIGDTTDIAPLKGAYSDAFKRAAVKFGVGRFLYDTKNIYARIAQKTYRPIQEDLYIFENAQKQMNAANQTVEFEEVEVEPLIEEQKVEEKAEKVNQITEDIHQKLLQEIKDCENGKRSALVEVARKIKHAEKSLTNQQIDTLREWYSVILGKTINDMPAKVSTPAKPATTTVRPASQSTASAKPIIPLVGPKPPVKTPVLTEVTKAAEMFDMDDPNF